MNRHLLSVALLCMAMIVIVGCRGAQVYNIAEAPITPVSGEEPPLEQITRAIVTAGAMPKPPWGMQVIEPGLIRGTLNIRRHMAMVEITYTTKSYSITYNDSENLRYNPEENTIHSNYNAWIQHLDTAIKRQIAAL